MSLINELLKKKQQQKGFLAAIGGPRLAGKSTLAGTLPGKTLVIQPAGIEAGNLSPVRLAQSRGNHLDLIEFERFDQLEKLLNDRGIAEYDNIYVDGISAFTELLYKSPEFEAAQNKGGKRNVFEGFSFIQDQAVRLVEHCKSLAENQDKNVFITYAIKHKYDAQGNVTEAEMESKGNATRSLIVGKCPNVLTIVSIPTEEGGTVRKLLTHNHGPYIGRLGNILDTDNPKKLDADLGELLTYVNRT
jgi:hypothetical protein